MAKVVWHVSTDRVGSKMTGEFELEDHHFTIDDDGNRVVREEVLDSEVFEVVSQRINYGWDIVE